MSPTRVLAVVAILTIPSFAKATTFDSQEFVCPVGGEKFTADVIASMTSWGQRPDGRRYGTTPIVPLPECPQNGFVFIGEEFTEAEVDKLTPLVLGSEYQALRKTDTLRYRAWWLMDKLGQDSFDMAFTLLAASWETDEDLSRKERYQRQFIDAAQKLPWSEEKREDWFWANVRAANALRELGQFDDSNALLESLDTPSKRSKDEEGQKWAAALISGLKQLNAELNRSLEPTNLIPAMVAATRCQERAAHLTPVEISACAKGEVKEAIEIQRRAREENN